MMPECWFCEGGKEKVREWKWGYVGEPAVMLDAEWPVGVDLASVKKVEIRHRLHLPYSVFSAPLMVYWLL